MLRTEYDNITRIAANMALYQIFHSLTVISGSIITDTSA
jgi:hypothetical protein